MKGGAGVASRNKVTGLSRAWPLCQIVTCSSAGSAGGGVRQDAAVELLVGGGNHIDVELGVHLGARPLAQARSAPHMIERPDDALGKVVDTVGGRQVAVVPMSDDVLGTATVEGNDGRATRHRLDQGLAEGLFLRRNDGDVGGRVEK